MLAKCSEGGFPNGIWKECPQHLGGAWVASPEDIFLLCSHSPSVFFIPVI